LVLANRDSNADNKIVDRAILLKWIRKAKKGDIGAYQNIYEAYARKILNFVYRMVNSLEEAEDLTQDTFVAVYQKLGTLKDNRKFEPWLFRIARNYVYQRYRTRTPSTVSIISSLPEKYREVFVLSALQRFSYQQIADIVGRSLSSVKTDIHRARLEVRKRVRDYLGV
jgi:RNA polymerase sigma-70 factor (ECF subfamily)